MAELEKVIRGLECVICPNKFCGDCSYFIRNENDPDTGWCNRDAIYKDALTLMEAQEPRVMTQQELKEYLMINESGLLSTDEWIELSQRAPVYMEHREPDEYQVNWWTVERLRPWAMEEMFWDNYGTKRRCWTSRPTKEQRKAVKWG